jgi:two-component system, NarL family, nitrate/nitrite response regulator NarL
MTLAGSHSCAPPNRRPASGRLEGSASGIAKRLALGHGKAVQLRGLIVDDSDTFLTSASRLLESQGVEIVGTATSSREALELVAASSPDLALVDVELGDEDGLALASELGSSSPATRVIMISTYDRDQMQELIAASSAVGFLPKSRLSGDAVRALLEADQRSAR